MLTGRQLTPIDYWLMVKRHKWLLMLPLVLVTVGTVVWVATLPNIYRASALILVEAQKVPESYVKATVSAPVEERLRVITQQIMSRTWLEKVIRELGLVVNPQDTEAVEQYIAVEMRPHIEVDVTGKGGKGFGNEAFTISYEGSDPRTVTLVVNKLVSLFIDENLKVREQQAIGTTEFLNAELQRVQTQLQTQEQAISQFKQQYMGELPEQQDANLRALDRLQLQLQASIESMEGTRNRKSLLMQQQSSLPAEPAEAILSPEVTKIPLDQQLAKRREALSILQQTYTEKYPDILNLQREIAALEARVMESQTAPTAPPPPTKATGVDPASLRWRLQEEINQINLEVQQLERQQASIRTRIAAYEQKVANTPQREQELSLLTRDYESTRQNYASLLEREMQAKVAENLEKRQQGEQFRVLDAARVPTKPWKPNRLRLLMIGLALALALGGGSVYLAEYVDHSFRDPEDLKQFTALPVFATIPMLITAREQRQRRLKIVFVGIACMLLPVAALAAVHMFWMPVEVVFARTLELLTPYLERFASIRLS